jgi:hypothetical protein
LNNGDVDVNTIASINFDSSDTLWGAESIGREANIVDANGNVELRKTFHRLESGHLPAKKVGRTWVSSVSAIRRALEIEKI